MSPETRVPSCQPQSAPAGPLPHDRIVQIVDALSSHGWLNVKDNRDYADIELAIGSVLRAAATAPAPAVTDWESGRDAAATLLETGITPNEILAQITIGVGSLDAAVYHALLVAAKRIRALTPPGSAPSVPQSPNYIVTGVDWGNPGAEELVVSCGECREVIEPHTNEAWDAHCKVCKGKVTGTQPAPAPTPEIRCGVCGEFMERGPSDDTVIQVEPCKHPAMVKVLSGLRTKDCR